MTLTRSIPSATAALVLGVAALAVAPVASAHGWQVGIGAPMVVQRAPVVVQQPVYTQQHPHQYQQQVYGQPHYQAAPVYSQPAPVYVQPAPVYVQRPQVIGYAPPAYFNERHHRHHGAHGYRMMERDRY